MSTTTTIVSGPSPKTPDITHCDPGGHRLAKDAQWWLVADATQGWTSDRGAACADHLPATDQ